ncbi:MAG: hypothetical protein V1809_04775 [Planctomycetota bacterium]
MSKEGGLIITMPRVGLVSCVSAKRSRAVPARDLYISPWFVKARAFVEQCCDVWFILSAKHGLVRPTEVITPYEETLNTQSVCERREWANRVWSELRPCLNPNDCITILAGERYRDYLVPLVEQYGCHVDIPMHGLGIGRQLRWLTQQMEQPGRDKDVARFYSALHALEHGLGGKHVLGQSTAQQSWPTRGVYFFFEPGELRSQSNEHRVVRIGTHGVSRGSKATLWNRLRTHRGTMNGLGNHRGSIFRLHVGAAIVSRDPSVGVSSWGLGQSAPLPVRQSEYGLERLVSAHIGSMSVLWLAIEDESGPSSDRAYIERNLIGLLVGKAGPADPPSDAWLGLSSPDSRIRKSGLWNLDFLEYPYSSRCLDLLDQYVAVTIGKRQAPSGQLAPRNWYSDERNRTARGQLSLFDEE